METVFYKSSDPVSSAKEKVLEIFHHTQKRDLILGTRSRKSAAAAAATAAAAAAGEEGFNTGEG